MPRRKLSEYRSKQIIHDALGLAYIGWEVHAATIEHDLKDINGASKYVVKVDQAIKGRFKRSLVTLDVPRSKIAAVLKKYSDEGYSHFIVEPYVIHESSTERYLTLMQKRRGTYLSYSELGGVNIESNSSSITAQVINDETDWTSLAKETGLTTAQLQALLRTFKKNHFVFLEINPYIKTSEAIALLDLAIEVDDAGQSFVSTWTGKDIREPKRTIHAEEEAVHQLDKGSVASFNLSVLNPAGSIFLLLSGGGASIVIADEVHNRGFGGQLANYGEYSGNPKAHEAQKYTGEVLKLLFASPAPRKVLFIGGAVANFTDIATTFAGVIAAIDEYAKELAKHNVKVYVRRGGPRQELGLENIRAALEGHGILGGVYDPSITITAALEAALEGLHE